MKKEDPRVQAKRAEAFRVLQEYGIEVAARLYLGATVRNLEPTRAVKDQLQHDMAKLTQLQFSGRPYRLPGHYADQEKIQAEEDRRLAVERKERRRRKKAMRALLAEAGIIKTR